MVFIGVISTCTFTKLLTVANGRTLCFRCSLTSANDLPVSLSISTAESLLIISLPTTLDLLTSIHKYLAMENGLLPIHRAFVLYLDYPQLARIPQFSMLLRSSESDANGL